MKNVKSILAVMLVALMLVSTLAGCGVDKEYEYNTEVISLENAPKEGDADIEAITGYAEDSKQELLELPYAIGDTGLEITSIGKYTGLYTDNGENTEVTDILGLVVKNTSDKVVSYSSIQFEYAKDKQCTFNATNLPSQQSVLLFTSVKPVQYDDVKKLELIDSMAVPADSLPMVEGVGVDCKDGEFIVTNHNKEDVGDVYIIFKNTIDGNVYLGGITYSVEVFDLKGYETRKVPAENFDAEKSVIVAVQNYEN